MDSLRVPDLVFSSNQFKMIGMKKLLLGGILLLFAGNLGAMGLRTSFSFLGFSADGTYALVKETISGPEGGRQVQIHLMGGTPFSHRVFVLEESLGDGSRIQERIPEGVFQNTKASLKAVLKTIPFPGIQFFDRPPNPMSPREVLRALKPQDPQGLETWTWPGYQLNMKEDLLTLQGPPGLQTQTDTRLTLGPGVYFQAPRTGFTLILIESDYGWQLMYLLLPGPNKSLILTPFIPPPEV